MGKWLGIAMSVALVLALAACAPAGDEAEVTETESVTESVVDTAPMEAPAATEEPAMEEPAPAMEAPAMEEAAPAEPMDAAPAEPVDPAATPPVVDGAAAPADAPAADGAADASGLVGTKWKYDAYTAEFAADNVLNVAMGEMKVPGEYKLGEDGTIEISAMGSSFSGTWDGEKLTINGDELEKVE